MKCLFRRRSDFTVCSGNVHSLVENSGDIRICWKQGLDSNRLYDSVDRKLDLLVGELQRYKVSVGEFKKPSGLELMCDQPPMDILYCTLEDLLLCLMMLWLGERV